MIASDLMGSSCARMSFKTCALVRAAVIPFTGPVKPAVAALEDEFCHCLTMIIIQCPCRSSLQGK